MMKMLAGALVVCLAIAPLAAQQPSQPRGDQAKPTSQTGTTSPTLIWSGVGLMAAGAIIEVIGFTSAADVSVSCVGVSIFASCTSTKSPSVGVVTAGAGVAVSGAILTALGLRHVNRAPSVVVQPHRVEVVKRWTF